MFKTIKDLKIKKIKLNNFLNTNDFYKMRANCNNDKKCFFVMIIFIILNIYFIQMK